jgi:hypothetical protein
MYNSRAPHPPGSRSSSFQSTLSPEKNHKKPHHPSKVQSMNCYTANASGRCFRFTTLHFRATLRFATFRSIPFIVSPSLGNPRKSASIHSIALMPSPFHSAPLWLPSPQPKLKAKTGSYIPPLTIRYFPFSHHPCFSPCQPAVCPA